MSAPAAADRANDPGEAAESGRDAAPSKTRLKQHSQALQVLGGQIAALPPEQLAGLPLDDDLRAAIETYQRTRSHEGRRRQLQYVGKLMRGADEAALREALAAATLGSARASLALHEAERWRAELVADDGALGRWLLAHPDTDAQRLRSLVRAARRDGTAPDPGARQARSYRELFQFIKPMIRI
jgi:ribosome-associated protein